MHFDVDLHSPKPVYQQLIDQVKLAVASGWLRPGDRLPSIRDVAVEVRVNRNTIARVYSELEREGVVYTRPGQGAFVSDRGSQIDAAIRRAEISGRLDDVLAQARLFGMSRREVKSLVEERLAEMFVQKPTEGSSDDDK